MTVHGVALLVGLFVVPVVLLWLAHGIRNRGPQGRGVFWGGVIGHSLGVLVTLGVMFLPPVEWGAAVPRTILVYWSMAAASVIGALVGAWRAGRRGSRPA